MQLLGQMASGEWIVRLKDGSQQLFQLESEAIQFMSKLKTAQAIVSCVQTLTTVMDSGPDLWQEYFDVKAAQGDFTDADVTALGITVADLISCVTLLDNLKKFFGSEAVASDAYRVVVNRVRRV